jgi:hypothetical protein
MGAGCSTYGSRLIAPHSQARCDRGSLAHSFALLRGRTAVVFGARAIPAPVHRPALADPNLLC